MRTPGRNPRYRSAIVSPMALRPLGIGEIVDGAVKLVRVDLRHLWGAAAGIFLPVALVQWWDLLDADLAGETTASGIASLFLMGSGLEGWSFPVLVVLALIVLRPFVLHSADEVLFGRARATIPQVLHSLPKAALSSLLKTPLIVAGALLGGVPGIVVATRLAVVESTVVSEGTGPVAAIPRSYRLVKGRTFPILGTLTVLLLVRLGVALVLNGAAASGVFLDLQPAATRLFIVLATYLTAVMIWPVALAAKALVFADLRVRKEALDLDLLIGSLDQPGAGGPAAGRWRRRGWAGLPPGQ